MKAKRVTALFLAAAMTLGLAACGNANSGGTVEETKQETTDTEQPTEDAAQETTDEVQSQEVDTGKEITLQLCTHYAGNGESPNVDYAMEKVKEKYPNVSFEIDTFPQDGGQALKARAATGSLPDIIWLNSGLIEPLAKSGSLVQLDEYIAANGFEDSLNDAAREYCQKSSDGHIYMYSVESVQPLVWYYNKEIFEQNNIKVPENFDELMTAVKELREKDIIPMALFGKEPWPLGAFFEAFAMKENSAGLRPFAEGTAKASDEDYQKAIGKMKQVIDAGIFQEGVTNADHDTAYALFTAGKAAMFQNGSWAISDMVRDLGDKVDYFTTYPTADAGAEDTNAASFVGGGDTVGYGVSVNTEDVELATDVAKILAEAQAEYDYSYRGSIGSSTDFEQITPENPMPEMGTRMAAQIKDMSFESTMLQNFPNTEFATGFAEEMQKLLVGESVEEFTQNLDSLIESSNQ